MRVGERGSSRVRAETGVARGFADALRRARREDAAPRGARAGARLERRPAARTRPEGARGDAGAEARLAPPLDARGAPRATGGETSPAPELAALARTWPVAVAAANARHGAPLALSFGRSLDVELRTGTAGVELLLRPEPRLARIVEAELPNLLAAMRGRGVAVARAEVRPRGGTARRAR